MKKNLERRWIRTNTDPAPTRSYGRNVLGVWSGAIAGLLIRRVNEIEYETLNRRTNIHNKKSTTNAKDKRL